MDAPLRRPMVVTAEMGYGHLRAAVPLARALGEPLYLADRDPLASEGDRKIWSGVRRLHELSSRGSQLPFIGRPSRPIRGFGLLAAAQLRVWKPLGLRATVSHSLHPVYDHYVLDDDDNPVHQARRGLMQTTHAGLSATFSMDIGRVFPTLDAGIGGMWIRSPDAVVDGQMGGKCRSDGLCDTGLTCSAANVCELAALPQIHGGFAVDVMVVDRFAVGAEIRYFALLASPMTYPRYLIAALRASLRF